MNNISLIIRDYMLRLNEEIYNMDLSFLETFMNVIKIT